MKMKIIIINSNQWNNGMAKNENERKWNINNNSNENEKQ